MNNRTALLMACWGPMGGREGKMVNNEILGEFPEGLLMILENNPDFSIIDRDGNNAMHVSCSTNAIECIKIWAERKGDFNLLNAFGENCLTVAVHYGVLESVRYLCENIPGINYLQLDKEGANVIDLASVCPNEKVLLYMVQFLADKNEYGLIVKHLLNKKITSHNIMLIFHAKINEEVFAEEISKVINAENFGLLARHLMKAPKNVAIVILREFKKRLELPFLLINLINSKSPFLLFELLKIDGDGVSVYINQNTEMLLESLSTDVFKSHAMFNLLLDHFDFEKLMNYRNKFQQSIFIILIESLDNTNSIYHIGKLLEHRNLLEKIDLAKILDDTDFYSLTLFDYGFKFKNVLPFNYLNQLSGREKKFEFRTVKIEIKKTRQISEEELKNVRNSRVIKLKVEEMGKMLDKPEFDIFFDIFNAGNSHMTFNVKYQDYGIEVLYINDIEGLDKCVKNLETQKLISLDMETANTTNKSEILSLIQISTMKAIYVIDAILLFEALKNKLRDLFENPRIMKIIFSCYSDIKILYFYLQIRMVNFLDVCIAFNQFKSLKQGCGLKTVAEEVR